MEWGTCNVQYTLLGGKKNKSYDHGKPLKWWTRIFPAFHPHMKTRFFCYESIDYFSLYYYDTILYNNERHRETKMRFTRCTSVHRYLRSHTHPHTFGHNPSLPPFAQTRSGIILKTRDGWGTDSEGRREAEIKGSRRQRYFCYLTACMSYVVKTGVKKWTAYVPWQMPVQTHPRIVLVLLRILCNPSAHHSVVAAPCFISQVATILLILGSSCIVLLPSVYWYWRMCVCARAHAWKHLLCSWNIPFILSSCSCVLGLFLSRLIFSLSRPIGKQGWDCWTSKPGSQLKLKPWFHWLCRRGFRYTVTQEISRSKQDGRPCGRWSASQAPFPANTSDQVWQNMNSRGRILLWIKPNTPPVSPGRSRVARKIWTCIVEQEKERERTGEE